MLGTMSRSPVATAVSDGRIDLKADATGCHEAYEASYSLGFGLGKQ